MRGISHLLVAASLLSVPVGSLPVLAAPQVTAGDEGEAGSIGADFDTAVYRQSDGIVGFRVIDPRNSPFTGLQRGDIVIAVHGRYFTSGDTFRDFDEEVAQYYWGAPVKLVYLDASDGYRVMNQTARLAVRPATPRRWAAAPPRSAPPTRPAGAPVAARPSAATPDWGRINQYLDQLVAEDSRGWLRNEYRRGSIRNPRVKTLSASTYQLDADFSYVGGSPGHVRVRMANGKFSCIEFQDTLIGCRALRAPGQGAVIAATLVGLVVIAAIATSGSSSDEGSAATAPHRAAPYRPDDAPAAQRDYPDDGGVDTTASIAKARKEQEQREEEEREAARRSPRIGGETGPYGCASGDCDDRPK